jgi:hypothetical protein
MLMYAYTDKHGYVTSINTLQEKCHLIIPNLGMAVKFVALVGVVLVFLLVS